MVGGEGRRRGEGDGKGIRCGEERDGKQGTSVADVGEDGGVMGDGGQKQDA
jgi:hypothetical protein